jgi:hypothetical protein
MWLGCCGIGDQSGSECFVFVEASLANTSQKRRLADMKVAGLFKTLVPTPLF